MQTHSKIDTDPYGKPAIVFSHDGGVDGIVKDLKRMLSENLSQHLNLNLYQSYAQDAPSQSQQQNIASENEEIKVTITNTQAGEFRGTLFDMEDPSIRKEPAPSVRLSLLHKSH